MKFTGVIFKTHCVGLVGGDQYALSGRAQQPREFLIDRRDSFARIHDPDQGNRVIDRESGLLQNIRRNYRVVIGIYAARVDQGEWSPVPVGLAIDAVARNAGLVADDRAPLSD